MIYESVAESRHFFDFVFYESDKRKLYTYCPNCASTKEVEFKSIVPRNVSKRTEWVKKEFFPCSCYVEHGILPKYLHSGYEHAKAKTEGDIGEFCKNPDGSVSLNVYRHTASFAASEYGGIRPFYRTPVFFDEKTIEFRFSPSQKVQMKTRFYLPIFSRRICVGEYWSEAKAWRKVFVFDFIEESLEQLKGTFLEQYIPDLYQFTKALSEEINIDVYMNEVTIMFLIKMVECAAFRKLWRAGYHALVINKVFESLTPRNDGYTNSTYSLNGAYYTPKRSGTTINWNGQHLENILRAAPQKLDLVAERKELSISDITGSRQLEKIGIEINSMNIGIVNAFRFEDIQALFQERNIPLTKLFKYLRHEKNRNSDMTFNNLVSDYYDYLRVLQKLQTPLTNDVVFPSKLRSAHDKATQTFSELQNSEKNKLFASAVQKYKKLNYANEQFKIFVIDSVSKLQTEARKLHNCSAGYTDRIIGGESVIFLIRKKEKTKESFFMLELNPRNLKIVQNRGMRNCGAPKEVEEFATLWQQSVVLSHAKRISEKKKSA